MRMNSKRGTVVVEIIVISALALGGAQLAGWKPLQIFRKKPPTAQVTQLQADLAKAQAELEAARLAKAAAEAAERARQVEQVQWAQQMTTGAGEAIARIPSEHKTAESRLAADLIARGNFALALAVGDLPREKRVEILSIVDKALSGVQAERDQARAALAAADAELQQVTRAREQIAAEIPVLAAKLETKDAEVRAVQAVLTVKTQEVVQIADRLDAKDREAGSLGASLNRLLRVGALLGAAWLFLGWGAAPMLKLMKPGRLKNFLRDMIGYLTSGFLHHDAKRKLATVKTP
jgi:hypothetical protein